MAIAAPVLLLTAGLWSWGSPRLVPPSIAEPRAGIPGTATVTGSLAKEIIRGVIRAHVAEVKTCYDAELGRDPGLFGQIMVEFTIAASGRVTASELQKSTVNSRPVEDCVVQVVRKWKFPKPVGGGIVIVSYPFVFVPAAPIVLVAGKNGANRVELQPLGSLLVLHRSTESDAVPSNGLIAITEKGLLLVDTAWTPSQTEAILRWGDERLKRPWIGAVITHEHADRDGGLDALLRRGIPVSALDLTVDKLEKRGVRGVRKLFTGKVGEAHKDDRGFEAFYPGPGHAPDNIVLKFDLLLFGGCLIKAVEAPNLGFTDDADLKAWPAAVRRVQERYGNTMIVPGHGPVDETGAAFEHTLRLLENAH